MKKKLFALLALTFLSTLNPQLSTLFAQASAFTYQGRLTDGTNLANGLYDVQASLQDAASNTVAGPVIASAAVSDGLFTIALDFGAAQLTGVDRWLQLAVRTNGGGAFTPIFPCQPLTSTPYAVRAANATSFTGAISDGQLSANVARLNANQTFSGTVSFSSLSNDFAGSFTGTASGNGLGVSNTLNGDLWHLNRFSWHNTMERLGSGQPIQIMGFGEGGTFFEPYGLLMRYLWNIYPVGGVIGVSGGNVAKWVVASGAALVSNTNWYTQHGTLPAGGSIIFRGSDSLDADLPIRGTVVEVDYLQMTNAGTFKVQVSLNGGAYNDVISSVDANGTKAGVPLRWTNSVPADIRVKAVGLTGTTEILSFGVVNYDAFGVVWNSHITSGGLHWKGFFEQMDVTNVVGPIFRSWRPELIIYSERVQKTNWALYAPKWDAFMRTFLTNSDFVVINVVPDAGGDGPNGSDPTINDNFYLANMELRTNCAKFHWGYFDQFGVMGGVSNALYNGLIFTNLDIAATPKGEQVKAQALFEWLALHNSGANVGPASFGAINLPKGGVAGRGLFFTHGPNGGLQFNDRADESTGVSLFMNGNAVHWQNPNWANGDFFSISNIGPAIYFDAPAVNDSPILGKAKAFEIYATTNSHIPGPAVNIVYGSGLSATTNGGQVTVVGSSGALLLNEFLKQHREVEEQTSEIGKQHAEIQSLNQRLQKLERLMNKTDGGAK